MVNLTEVIRDRAQESLDKRVRQAVHWVIRDDLWGNVRCPIEESVGWEVVRGILHV